MCLTFFAYAVLLRLPQAGKKSSGTPSLSPVIKKSQSQAESERAATKDRKQGEKAKDTRPAAENATAIPPKEESPDKSCESPTNTGRTACQASKKAKQAGSTATWDDTQVCKTPESRINRKTSVDDFSGEKVVGILRRPQTLDEKATGLRKAEAVQKQKELEEALEEEKEKQREEEAEAEQNTSKVSIAGKGKKTQAKAKAKAARKAKAKAEAKAKAKCKAKAKSQAKGKSKASPAKDKEEEEEKEDENMKDHTTARSSSDPMPTSSPRKAKAAVTDGQQKQDPSPKKKKARQDEGQAGKGESKEGEAKEGDGEAKEKKKKAHKLYMRFWRNIQSPYLSFRKNFEN